MLYNFYYYKSHNNHLNVLFNLIHRPAKKFDVASFFHEQAEEGDDEEDPEDENNPITEVQIMMIGVDDVVVIVMAIIFTIILFIVIPFLSHKMLFSFLSPLRSFQFFLPSPNSTFY